MGHGNEMLTDYARDIESLTLPLRAGRGTSLYRP
jgi:hypothetical protein